MLLAFGASLNAVLTVITRPEIPLMVLVSTNPVGINTEIVGDSVVSIDRLVVLSMVIVVVVALLMRPLRREPAFSGSAISITIPGRRMMPLSIETEKVTVSVRFCSLNNAHLPARCA